MKRLASIEDKFSGAFARDWERTLSELGAAGIILGACVRNANGKRFRLTDIDPNIFLHYEPLASVSCYGVLCRADGTWGDHKHWVGRIADLTVEDAVLPR